jgi:MFS family permease
MTAYRGAAYAPAPAVPPPARSSSPATSRPPDRRGRSGVLGDAAFRRLWCGMTVSKLGTSVAGIATPLIAVQVLHAGAFTVSLLTAAAWLPWLLIGLPAGAWIDRRAKCPVMLACDLVSAVLIASVPVAA